MLSHILYAFQDKKILNAITEITGIEGLEADPSLYAGGLSMMEKDDFLNPHIDNSHNGQRTHYRKLNLLYYCTPEWAASSGGHLELWDTHVKTPKLVESKFNRLIVMGTNKTSWHSVSPVKRKGQRCCVSNYYFSKHFSPYEKDYYHVTSFLGRPNQPFKRTLGRIDNRARNWVATQLGINRGKDLVNTKPS